MLLAEKDAAFTRLWKEAEKNVMAQEAWDAEYGTEPELPYPIKTRSGVSNNSTLTESFHWEVAFMTDADLMRWTESTAKTLGLPQDDRLNEDGSVLRGAYVSLRDLPAAMKIGDVLSLMKVRFSLDRSLTVTENLLQRQLHSSQTANVKKAATAKVLSRRNPNLLLNKLDSLPTLVALQAKAAAAEAALKQKEAEGTGVDPEDQVDLRRSVVLGLGSLDDEPARPSKKPRKDSSKAKAAPKQASKRERESQRERETSPAPSGTSRTRRPPRNFEGKSSAGSEMLSESEIRKRLPGDPELQRVACRLGKVPDCFLSLQPQRFMNGEKLGRSLRSAMASVRPQCSNIHSSSTSLLAVISRCLP